MQAGGMRGVLVLQQQTGHRSNLTTAATWANVATAPRVRVRWMRSSGNEALQRSGELAEATHVVRCRYRSDITTKHRFQSDDGNTDYDILLVDNLQGLGRELEITLKQRSR